MNHSLLRKVILWIIATLTFCYLAFKLVYFSQWHDFSLVPGSIFTNKYFYITLLLPFLNFFVEAIKWQQLLKPSIKISKWQSLRSVLSGVSTGILTPGRVGEIGGRILPYTSDNLAFSSTMFVVGSIFQTTITFALGLFSLLFINISCKLNLLLSIFGWGALGIAVLIGIILLIKHKLSTYYPAKKIQYYTRLIQDCSINKLAIVGSLSLIRYFIYAGQLFIALKLFNAEIQILTIFPLIFFFYFGITFLPGFIFADLGIRGSLALFLFGTLVSTSALILVPVFLIWILNNCIPAILGLGLLVRQK